MIYDLNDNLEIPEEIIIQGKIYKIYIFSNDIKKIIKEKIININSNLDLNKQWLNIIKYSLEYFNNCDSLTKINDKEITTFISIIKEKIND